MDIRRLLVLGFILSLGGMILSVFLSCKHGTEGLDQLDKICFESQILPVFQNSCAISGCHDTPGNESGYVFADYQHIMEAVTPGDPEKSPAYTSLISGSGEEGIMPPGHPLSKQNRTLIRVWIEQGALNESCVQSCDTVSVMTFTGHVWPIIDLNCKLCHSGTSPSGGVPLTDYCEVAIQAANGHLAGVLRDEIYPLMPPNGSLPECQIRQVELWIQGDQDTLCTQNPDTSGYSNPKACFQRDILPVLQSSCAISGCHDVSTHREGYIFNNFSNTLNAVSPGNPSGSKLYEIITSGEDDRMPPSPYQSLSAAAVDSIYSWISYGALDEYCGNACDTISAITFSGIIWPLIEQNCRGCHSGASPSGGISLTNYTQVAAQATSGKLTGVLHDGSYVLMPPAGSLSECMIRQVEMWVDAGILNNK
jgi:Planctomycete cytochrome C